MEAVEQELLIALLWHDRGGGADPLVWTTVINKGQGLTRRGGCQHDQFSVSVKQTHALNLYRSGGLKLAQGIGNVLLCFVGHLLTEELALGGHAQHDAAARGVKKSAQSLC